MTRTTTIRPLIVIVLLRESWYTAARLAMQFELGDAAMSDDQNGPKYGDTPTPELFSKFSLNVPESENHSENELFSGETQSHQDHSVVGNSERLSATSDSQASSIPEKLGRFHHIEVVKSGGFGIVCRAQDSQAGRFVALKFPRPDKIRDQSDLKMFIDEANRAMELDHPGIVKTYSVEESEGLLAIVQEFIDGSDLRAEQTAMTNHQVIATLVAKIADALAYAHRRGVYHRDLKPANILIDQQGNPYIADFGLAMYEREQLFLPAQRCGTPHYMPPEQVAGLTRRLDGRSDIWSLGVILYELLTKRRPFLGRNEHEIFDQIEHNDPRPPRQIDASIHPELQRICLKCLERQQRDRYPTADDLADDLRHWIANPAPDRAKSGQRFVPRGLRAFTVEDADFFLELIPGTRNRNGMPNSLKFWLNRILLPVSVDLLTPVGVVFGPSGSGKSSYVRAGLLPLLSPDILAVVVDCSATDTEAKLLKFLIERLENVPAGIGLIDLCSGISQGLWRPKAKSKVLLVLDQFEQRLSRGDDFQTADLVKALRFCDGRVLQALLLCRDDFFTHLSRFTDRLGMDLREGDNAQAIDLFDRKHALKVLIKYGQSYSQLPDQTEEITPEQDEFLQAVISELATADYVVCVRLSLFAEMFRDRPWTSSELRVVGGVTGIGEKFLEATFGPTSRDKRLRSLGTHAQKILGALLPPLGSDIRSGCKNEAELLALTGLENARPTFQAVLKTLDHQLKLITRMEDDESTTQNPNTGSAPLPAMVFQLTHDSMIESIRAWLERQSGRTREGRAGQRLRELGLQVVPGQTPRYLPTHFEWVLWQWLLRSKTRTKAEQAVWNAARSRFLRDLGLSAAALVVLGLSIGWWAANVSERQRVSDVKRAVDSLTQQPFTAPAIDLALIDQRHELAVPQLQAIHAAQPGGSLARIGAAYGLIPYDRRVQTDLIATVVATETEPQQLERLVSRLAIPAESRAQIWAPIYRNPNEDLRCRLRAFAAEVCQGPISRDWATHAQAMAAAYAAESAESLPHWLKLLGPAREELRPHLQTLFADEHPAADPGALALGIVELSKSKSATADYLVQHLPEWKTRQFQAAMNAVVSQGCREEFLAAATQRLSNETNPWAKAALSIALARLEHLAPLIELYSQPADQPAAIHAVNGSVPGRLEVKILGQIYREQDLGTFGNADLRRAVLMAFCLQAPALVDGTTQEWLEEIAHHHIVNDPDAGCFSSAELLFRRLGNDSTKIARRERRAKSDENGILGNVMIDASGLAFSILPRAEDLDERMAVCTTELTYEEMLDFLDQRRELVERYGRPKIPESKNPAVNAGPRRPFQHLRNRNDLALVYEYCNWLSENQGIEPSKWSYPAELTIDGLYDVMVDANAAGFRLSTHDEWQVANRSSDSLLDLVSPEGPVISNYAWSMENVRISNGGVGNQLCNTAGLFDMFGNMDEICHSIVPSNQGGAGFLLMGQTVRAEISRFNSAPKIPGGGPWNVNNLDTTHTGFRIARRLGPTN